MANANLDTKFISLYGSFHQLTTPQGMFMRFNCLTAAIPNKTYPTNCTIQNQVVNDPEEIYYNSWQDLSAIDSLWVVAI